MEGDIIVITKKDPHDVDDGWWEGEINGTKGLFPSLVVEPCLADGAPMTPDDGEITEVSSRKRLMRLNKNRDYIIQNFE